VFVTETLLASGCNDLYLQTALGDRVLRDQLGKGRSLERITASKDQRVMAAAFDDIHGGAFDTDMTRKGVTIVVYDILSKTERARCEVSPLPFLVNFSFALSADGSKLAVLNDRTVTVYSVP
jgi:hypothetical protein